MNFGITINLDKVILIGRCPDFKVKYKSELETRWLLIKGIEDKIFCLKSEKIESSDLVKEIEKSDYEIIDLEQRIKEKIKETLDKEFNDVFEQNIDKDDLVLDYDIKENIDTKTGEITLVKIYKTIEEADLFGKNLRNDEYRTKNLGLDITEIDKGIISVENTNIKYDLINDKLLSTDREILREIYYQNEIKHIISYEKYKQGICSDFYNEIAKINEFIKDKQSITVKLKNGTIFKTGSTLSNILNIYFDGSIYISSLYEQKIIEGERFNDFQYKVDQLESLKYGKEELKIDSSKLILERTNNRRSEKRRNRRGDVEKWDNIIKWLI